MTQFQPRVFACIALFALLLCVDGCGAGGGSGTTGPPQLPPVPASLPTPPIAPPASSIFLGAFVNPQGLAGGGGPSGVAAFEALIGRKLALDEHYYGWTDVFPTVNETDDLANGRIPVVSWNCGVPNAQINNGSQDALIARRAEAIAAYGGPIFLRYSWEMNLATHPGFRTICYDPNTDLVNFYLSPSEFVNAWQRIRQIFAAAGAGNVIWLFNPSGKGANPVLYYPGDDEVDWIGLDDYDDANISFVETYATAYNVFKEFNKPILIAETGAQAAVQTSFFATAASDLAFQYPLVRGYMYFDAQGNNADWILTGAGVAAFTTFANDPYLSATPAAAVSVRRRR